MHEGKKVLTEKMPRFLGPRDGYARQGQGNQRYSTSMRLIERILKGSTWTTPVKQVEFQIDLIYSVALMERSPNRLAPSKMQQLSG